MDEGDDIVLNEDAQMLEDILDLEIWDFHVAPTVPQIERVVELLGRREDRDSATIQRCIAECHMFLKDHSKGEG